MRRKDKVASDKELKKIMSERNKKLQDEIVENYKEIERLENVSKARQVLMKAQGKKITQLLKEKEWLIQNWAQDISKTVEKIEGVKIYIERDMQQALKEG